MARSFDLGPHFEKVIDDLVASGRYPDADVAARVAIGMLEEAEAERAEKLAKLKGLIEEGLASGPGEPWDLEATRRQLRDEIEAMKRAAE